jgi:hypothetical protein
MRTNEIQVDQTKLKHRRDFTFQILVPVLVVTLLVFVLLFLTIHSSFLSPGNIEKWAHISLVLLLSPFIVLSLFGLTVIIVLSVLVSKLHSLIPRQARKLRDNFDLIMETLQGITARLTVPLIKIRAFFAGVKKIIHISSWKND